MNKCPYCKRRDCVPAVVLSDCDNYGSNFYTVRCIRCKKIIEVRLERKVVAININKSKKKENELLWQ